MLIRQIWMNGPNTGLFVKPFFWVTPGPCSQSLLSPVINCWGRFFVKCCPRFLRLSSVYFESIKCGETWWRSQTIHTWESERGRYLSSIKQSGHQCKLRWKICLHQSHFCLPHWGGQRETYCWITAVPKCWNVWNKKRLNWTHDFTVGPARIVKYLSLISKLQQRKTPVFNWVYFSAGSRIVLLNCFKKIAREWDD